MATRHLNTARLRGTSAPAMLLVLGALALNAGPALATEIDFDEAELYFELNATDRDVGLQGLVDGDAWRLSRIVGPNGTQVLRAATSNRPEFGMTELFFESNEPLLDDRSFAELLALFPEGEYQFRGQTIEGPQLVSSTELTDNLPCPAEFESPAEEDEEVSIDMVTIEWTLQDGVFDLEMVDPDTGEIGVCMADDVETVAVQVVIEIEIESEEEEEEDLLRVLSVDLPPVDGEFHVPREFFEGAGLPNDEAETKVEIVVTEDSGNRTASERSFEVTE